MKRVLAASLTLMLVGCDQSSEMRILTGESMGTTYRIHVAADRDIAAAQAAVEKTLAELDATLSTWREDSWVSRFNRSRTVESQSVPELVWPLLVESQALSKETEGRFDITVGPLVSRWGFGAHPSSAAPPEDDEIQRLLEHCGYDKLQLDVESHSVAKTHPAVELDFSAIAKGYAVDLIAEALDALGHKTYLIEFGGDLRVRGAPPGSAGWRIARPNGQTPLILTSGAVATSGPQHQHRDDYCHVIDPRTGSAVVLRRSVTAQAATCARADALATALAVSQSQ